MTLKELEKLSSLLDTYAEHLKHYKADPSDPFRGNYCRNDCDNCELGVTRSPIYSVECAIDILTYELDCQIYTIRKRG